MSIRLPTRINGSGYAEFFDRNTQRWTLTHRRVAEKKLGRLPTGAHVHHRDGEKRNNRYSNLVAIHPKVHRRLHAHPDACLRCGRDGHWVRDCGARTFYDGSPLR